MTKIELPPLSNLLQQIVDEPLMPLITRRYYDYDLLQDARLIDPQIKVYAACPITQVALKLGIKIDSSYVMGCTIIRYVYNQIFVPEDIIMNFVADVTQGENIQTAIDRVRGVGW